MKSVITITVEHGETTDSVQEFMEVISRPDHDGEGGQWLEAFGFDFKVVDTEVRVDVP